MYDYNTIILGFGKGGKTAAGFLAKQGEKVALIEKDPTMYGGTCINVGCIPSKSLVAWSKEKHADYSNIYFQKAIARKRQLVEALRQKNFAKLNDLPGVDIILGTGKFIDSHTISITKADGSTVELTAEKIIINTGAKTFIPAIPGLKLSKKIVTSKEILDLDNLPDELIILGGGYIGLEFASIYAGFGTKVTILEAGPEFLPREDRDIAESIANSLAQRNINLILNAKVTEVIEHEHEQKVSVHYQEHTESKTIFGSMLLIAVGRIPNTAELNLQAAHVETDNRGAIVVNEIRQTSQPHIYAFGDVVGAQQFTYISLDDFRIFRNHYQGKNIRQPQNRLVPYSVFIEPAFSRIGLNEREAKAQGYDYKVVSLPAAAIPKANVLQKTTGLLKAIIDQQTDKILGVALFCEESHEMINIITPVMELGGTYQQLRDQIFTHPTMSEALNDLFELV